MRPQGHTAASLLTWSFFSGQGKTLPYTVLCGNLPDFDRELLRPLKGSSYYPKGDHHTWPSHSFLMWMVLSIFGEWMGRRIRRSRDARMGIMALWSHLFLDIYADGIVIFWPKRKKFGLYREVEIVSIRKWLLNPWPKTPTGRVERTMFLTALTIWSYRYWKNLRSR